MVVLHNILADHQDVHKVVEEEKKLEYFAEVQDIREEAQLHLVAVWHLLAKVFVPGQVEVFH